MNPFVILLWGRDALLARETLTCIYIYIYIYIFTFRMKNWKSNDVVTSQYEILTDPF